MRWRSTPDRPRRSGPGSSWQGTAGTGSCGIEELEKRCQPARPAIRRRAVTSATSAESESAFLPASWLGLRLSRRGNRSHRCPPHPARDAGRPGQAGSVSPAGSTSMLAGPRRPPRQRGLRPAGMGVARLKVSAPRSQGPVRQPPVSRHQRPAGPPPGPLISRQRRAVRWRGRRRWPAITRISRTWWRPTARMRRR